MAEKIKAPRGTVDITPQDSYKWRLVEKRLADIAENYGFKEIRVPTFESTNLFTKSVGDGTDVVQKEMYTFNDKGNRSITLRPEGTAGVIRAVIENNLMEKGLPVKLFYILSCFRYEKPQAGRLREFHQFGVEMFGSKNPTSDVEIILVAKNVIDEMGLKNISLQINSIGCPICRAAYEEKLVSYFRDNVDKLCSTCVERLETNPLRIMDCKVPVCKEVSAGAPVILDHLCDECEQHFGGVKTLLDSMEVDYEINPYIVRGLDYYTKTVFEFVSTDIGSQGTVCGGGRYDGAVENLGGKSTPAMGFGMGLERLLMVMDSQNVALPSDRVPDLFVASMGEKANRKAFTIVSKLREVGFFCEMNTMDRSLKAQMKNANRLSAKYSVVIGDSELESDIVQIKKMDDGKITEIKLSEIEQKLYDIIMAESMAELVDNIDSDDFLAGLIK